MDLASLQTTVSRLSARLNENLSETARDLGLQGIDPASLAGAGAAGKYLEDGTVVTQDGIRETKKLLETRREASMAEGLRRVLAMMLRGLQVITFFPQVVQCLSSSSSSSTTSSASSIQIRSLVSIYILRQAAFEPDLALLAVNMYQKDLRDPNPVIRALAIRTLAGMELESIVTLVLMSLKTASRDGNWFVRRTVAESLDKVYILDPSHLISLIPILETGLADAHPLVMGSSLAAFETICPSRFDLLHPHYRRYCKSLVDADEWSQVTILRVLEKYARDQFQDPTKGAIDPDLSLLLQCIEPLLWNRNAAVVLSAVRVAYRTSPTTFSKKHAAALARLLQSPPEVQGTVLAAIATIASNQPTIFAEQFLQQFYVYQLSDDRHNKVLKLQILVLLANETNINAILAEFLAYTSTSDPAFRREVIASIGECAKKVPKVRQSCLKTLLTLLDEFEEDDITAVLLAEAAEILWETDIPSDQVKRTLTELMERYREDRFETQASLTQFRDLLSSVTHHLGHMLPGVLDVVRRGVKSFPFEADSGKYALLKLSGKVLALSQASGDSQLVKIAVTLHTYLLTLGRYDASWSIRASTRMSAGLTALLGISVSEETGDADIEAEAFASGESLSAPPAALQGLQTDPAIADAVRKTLTNTASGSKITSNPVHGSSTSTAKDTKYFARLSGWQALPEWPAKAPQHGLRNSTVQAVAPENKAYRGFGNTTGTSPSSSSASSSSRRAAGSSQLQRRRAPHEKVVLVPTESLATGSVDKSKPSNLQAFLESSDENEEGEEDEEEEEEEESESEDETESSDDAVGAAAAGLKHGESSDDEDSDDDGEDGTDTDSDEDGQHARALLAK